MVDRQVFRVPRSRASATHQTLRSEIMQALEPIIFDSYRSSYAIREELEHAFAKEVQQSYAVSVHSGTVGLFIALRACNISSGDEVITVGNSDISTTGVIRKCGAIPVLCDVLETDYTINPEIVERLITVKTRAILPVDIHGHPANVKQLRPLADQYNLKIIEDAALASGAYDYGKPVGTFADVSMFSFAPFKPLGSVGNGAMIVTSDEEIDAKLRLLVGYGHDPNQADVMVGYQNYVEEGYNVPLDGLQAALLLVKLPYLKEWTVQRRAIVQALEVGLSNTTAKLPSFREESAPTFRSYTIRVDRQNEIYTQLRDAGIEVVLHYSPPISHYTVYANGLPNSDQLPITDRLATELVNLPITPELTTDDTDYMIHVLHDILKE